MFIRLAVRNLQPMIESWKWTARFPLARSRDVRALLFSFFFFSNLKNVYTEPAHIRMYACRASIFIFRERHLEPWSCACVRVSALGKRAALVLWARVILRRTLNCCNVEASEITWVAIVEWWHGHMRIRLPQMTIWCTESSATFQMRK